MRERGKRREGERKDKGGREMKRRIEDIKSRQAKHGR